MCILLQVFSNFKESTGNHHSCKHGKIYDDQIRRTLPFHSILWVNGGRGEPNKENVHSPIVFLKKQNKRVQKSCGAITRRIA